MIEINQVSTTQELVAARELVRAHIEAHSEAHNPEDTKALLAALPQPYVAPAGGIWLAWEGPEATGCIALKPLTSRVAEIKRMYVRPESRGRGIARALVQRVILEARARGYKQLRLGTLTTMQAAQNLYTSLGFRPIDPYRPVEFGDTVFYELEIGTPAV